jgi:hypothetical protein
MTWVVARVIKSDKDAVNVSGEWETKLLNEAHLTQKLVGKSGDNSPIKRNSDSAWEKSCSYSLEHGEDEVAVVMFTAEDNCSRLHGYNGANLAGIRHMLLVSIRVPVEEQQPFKKYMKEVLLSA